MALFVEKGLSGIGGAGWGAAFKSWFEFRALFGSCLSGLYLRVKFRGGWSINVVACLLVRQCMRTRHTTHDTPLSIPPLLSVSTENPYIPSSLQISRHKVDTYSLLETLFVAVKKHFLIEPDDFQTTNNNKEI